MCFDEGKLMAYVDGELTVEERAEVVSHLRECAECAAAVETLTAERAFAADALHTLHPSAEVVSLGSAARPRRQPAWSRYAAAAAAVLVLASLAFAPVRSAAAQFLQVFRVQRVQTISFSRQDLEAVSSALRSGSGHVDLKSLGEAWVDGGNAAPKHVTVAQAQQAVDFHIQLPSGLGDPSVTLQPARTFKFKLNVAAVNDALRYYGSDRTLPAAVDGKVFEIQIPPIVLARYGGSNVASDSTPSEMEGAAAGAVFVGQARSPQLVVPDGVDAAQLREVLLNLPFLPQNVRAQLASVNDWQSTLLVPAMGGTSRDVTIDGVPAVVISPDSPMRSARAKLPSAPLPEHVTTVVWTSGGAVHAVGGPIDQDKAIALAKSCMR